MAAEEGIQYQIEVQEGVGGGSGEVIIIYNCDSEELTPELLANTLTELSKQAALQQAEAIPVTAVVPKEEFLQSNDVPSTSQQFALEVMDCLDIKQEDQHDHTSLSQPYMVHNDYQVTAQCLPEVKTELKENTLSDVTAAQVREHSQGSLSTLFSDMTYDTELSIITGTVNPLPKSDVSIVKQEGNYLDCVNEVDHYACEMCDFETNIEITLMRHMKTEHGEEEPFECRNCGKRFRLELSLQIHSMTHETTLLDSSTGKSGNIRLCKSFVCPHCVIFKYTQKMAFNSHLKQKHRGMSVFRCSKCLYSCLTIDELQSHESSPEHDEALKLVCSQCGVSCKNMKRHLKVTHNDMRPFMCPDCGFRTKCMANLKSHMITHSLVKSMQCTECEYKCHTKNQLDRHMVRHTAERKFKCTVIECNFACKTPSSLKRHSRIHLSDYKYACAVCDYRTRDKIDLKRHKASEHPRNTSFECKECNLSFTRVAELKSHSLVIHKSSKICFCAYCDFSCEIAQELRDHMQRHYGKYSFSCNICGYTCRLISLHKRHMARHNKEKYFKCSSCNYACSEKADLQKHITSKHSQDKPFECPHCPYKCKFKTRLYNHISYVHSDVKPYFCKTCPYSAKSSENLKKHMGTHTGMLKTLQCVLCDYATAEKSKLKRHMQVHIKRAVFQ